MLEHMRQQQSVQVDEWFAVFAIAPCVPGFCVLIQEQRFPNFCHANK